MTILGNVLIATAGIYMSLIVMMNWLLSVTLFPAALFTWDSHVRAKERALISRLIPCLKRKTLTEKRASNKRLGKCLSNHLLRFRYLYLVIFAVLTVAAVYQGSSLEGATTPPQVFQRDTNLGWFSEWQRSGWMPVVTGSWRPPTSNNVTHVTPHSTVPHSMTPVISTPATPSVGTVAPITDHDAPVPPSRNDIDVQITWGLTGYVNGSRVNPNDPFSEWIGIPQLDAQFDPLTAPCIDHLAKVCDTLWDSGLLATPGRCLLSAFKQRMVMDGKWPLSDRTSVLYHLLLFIRNNIVEYQTDFSLNHFNWTDIKTRLLLHQALDIHVIWLRYSFHSVSIGCVVQCRI